MTSHLSDLPLGDRAREIGFVGERLVGGEPGGERQVRVGGKSTY